MQLGRRRRFVSVQRQRAFALCIAALIPVACAQGTEDPRADEDLQTAGTSNAAGSTSAGKSGAGTAGKANGASGAAAGGASAGAGGKSGASNGGSGGSGGRGGAAQGGAAQGGAAQGGAAQGGSGGAPAGGAPGGAGAPTGTAGSASVAGFSVQYKNLKPNPSSPYIECQVLASNAGPNSLAVSELKLRYYFTDEPKKAPQFQNNFQHINITGSQAQLTVTQQVVGMAPTAAMADTYIEFSFSSGSHSTLAPGEALEFAWQMQGPNPSTDVFTQSNDYSWDASKTALAAWNHIVLLKGTSPLWGVTP